MLIPFDQLQRNSNLVQNLNNTIIFQAEFEKCKFRLYFLTKYIIIKMRKLFIICALLFCLGTASAQQKFSVASPDGKLKLVLDIAPEKVAYSVKYGKQQLLEDSRLGFEFDSGSSGQGSRRERYKGGK